MISAQTVFNDSRREDSIETPVTAFPTYDEERQRIAFLNTVRLPAPYTMRTRDLSQIHHGSHSTFQLGDDGCRATGTQELELARGKVGETKARVIMRARHHDPFVLTDAGWRFKICDVILLEQPCT